MPTSRETIYTNAERTKLVDETDDDARLLAREGAFISDADAKQFGVGTDEAPIYDAIADHTEKHAGETPEEARRKREAMLSATGGDDDGPAVDGERGEKARTLGTANKAKPAPSNKVAPVESTTETTEG